MDTPLEIWIGQFQDRVGEDQYENICRWFCRACNKTFQIWPDIKKEPSEVHILFYALNDQKECNNPELWDAAFIRRVIKTCNKNLLLGMFHPDKHCSLIQEVPESKEEKVMVYNPYTEWTAAVNRVREMLNLCIQSMPIIQFTPVVQHAPCASQFEEALKKIDENEQRELNVEQSTTKRVQQNRVCKRKYTPKNEKEPRSVKKREATSEVYVHENFSLRKSNWFKKTYQYLSSQEKRNIWIERNEIEKAVCGINDGPGFRGSVLATKRGEIIRDFKILLNEKDPIKDDTLMIQKRDNRIWLKYII
jgi:hypothetical protein